MTASNYFPPVLLRWSRAPFSEDEVPLVESFDGAVLMVDMSGFTDLTDRLSRQGKSGAEQINDVLTRFFSDITDVIEKYGGTILDYEGDSVIIGWRDTGAQEPDGPLLSCCACASEIRQEFSPRSVNGHVLDVRISVGNGRLDVIHLGFDDGRRYLLTAGPAIDEAASLSRLARSGEALMAPQAASRIQKHFECEPRDEASFRIIASRGRAAGFRERSADFQVKSGPVLDAMEDYMLPLARARLKSALADWIGEVRQVTLIFVEIALNEGASDLGRINATAIEVESILESLGGVVLSIRLRQDLLLVEAAFGLPGEAGKNDDWRAIATVIELQTQARARQFKSSVGITTGRVFCGPFGAPHFRKYSVIGSAANLAARLRDVADGRILVDAETQKISKRSIGFDGPMSLRVPGLREAIQAYVPTEHILVRPDSFRYDIVGRAREREILGKMLDDCQSEVQVAMIYGEAGIGKSALVATLLAEFDEADRTTARGEADALDRQTPYLAWRPVLRQFLNLSSRGTSEISDVPRLQAAVASATGDAALAPLLNDVIDLNLPESRVTASMASNVRAENLRELLVKLVLHHLKNTTRVLVIEDAHWLDASSSALLADIIRAAPNALIVITSRLGETMAKELAELSAEGYHVRYIPLQRLEEEHISAVAQRALGQDHFSENLKDFIVRTSDGVPLFVEELCHLAVTLGRSGDHHLTELPKLLEATILSRIDTLSPEDQLVLKTASVFGLRFKRHLISRLVPLEESQIDVQAAVARIADLRLFQFDRDRPDDLEFRHQIIRDLIYDGMLSEQRAETHAAVAQELESQATAEDIEILPMLLTHWRRAGRPAKVVVYLERVAALRLRQFDNAGAIILLEEFRERVREPGVPEDRMRDARCLIMLGKAHSGLGKMVEAEAAFRAGLSKLDMRLPSGRRALALELCRQMVRQIRQRRAAEPIVRSRPVTRTTSSPDRQRAEMAAEAHEALMQIFYFSGQKGRLLHSALSAANLSGELGGATPGLAVNTAGLGAICGVIPLRKQATYYLNRASDIAKVLDVPSASSRVCLFSGLYDTAVANWKGAERAFLEGMTSAEAIRDKRLWCEHAVSFELTCSPWSLTDAFQGIDVWEQLLTRLETISLERNDTQVQACAVLGRLRGNRSMGRKADDAHSRAMLERLIAPTSPTLELIHYAEAAGLLAATAFENGDNDVGRAWMGIARQQLADLESGMKSRTLPALMAVFDACLRQFEHGTASDRVAAIQLAAVVTTKLRTFARIYPIGRPYLYICRGDLAALGGKTRAAVRQWRTGFSEAARLKMCTVAAGLSRRMSLVSAADSWNLSGEAGLLRQLAVDTPAQREVFQHIVSAAVDVPSALKGEARSVTYALNNS